MNNKQLTTICFLTFCNYVFFLFSVLLVLGGDIFWPSVCSFIKIKMMLMIWQVVHTAAVMMMVVQQISVFMNIENIK